MEKQELWMARVREWRASGKSMSEFSRGRDFTSAGLSYWTRRLHALGAEAQSSSPIRLARVVRTREVDDDEDGADAQSRAAQPTRLLVVEAGVLRIQIPEPCEASRLEAMLVAVGRAARAVDA